MMGSINVTATLTVMVLLGGLLFPDHQIAQSCSGLIAQNLHIVPVVRRSLRRTTPQSLVQDLRCSGQRETALVCIWFLNNRLNTYV